MLSPLGVADADGDLDDLLQSSFDLIADATCALAGFTAVALMVRVGEMVRNVAISGNEDARAALLGAEIPLADLESILPSGEQHGRYIFLPAEADYPESFDGHSWIPPIEASDDPERWHPEDALLAPLRDDDGDIVGILSLDLPASGRRPAGAEWDALQVYPEQARNGLLAVLERLKVAQQLHQLESARDLIRAAIHDSGDAAGTRETGETGETGEKLEPVLRRVGNTLLTHFGLDAAWFHVFGGPGRESTTLDTTGPRDLPMELRFIPYGEDISRRLWSAQELAVLGRTQRINVDESNTGALELAGAYLADNDVESMLYVPLGVGAECLGLMILLRPLGALPWRRVEREAIVEIGRDLGGLIAGVFARQRDEQVLADLRVLEAYKSEMVSTVSHELKNPLAAIRTNLELLAETSAPDEAAYLLAAVRRSAARMSAIVEDLQSLGSASSAAHRGVRPVELDRILRDVCAHNEDTAQRRGLRLTLDLPARSVLVAGAAAELDRLAGNLVSNAVKYSPAGGEIRVSLTEVGDGAVLSVSDDGIGISAEDQALLFTEFFRTNNAEALLEPGTGLGLAIVRRIVERHSGRIEVDSQLGEGSTFRVHLPREVAR
ncbi:sensor histidine kinase [Nocardioides sp. Iso805N]|uniref:sensor histidine kinase n=1 Tax=Nocardioides sp. Iso805N TaxID=1283287 RepID=UPI00037D96A0|nr:HAMP domain-containing sensor histidine kinase [Nocardioides sp. Iso805N]